MNIDYDDKGKFFTDVIRKEAAAAKIQTTSHYIEGDVHIRLDWRLKNELDVDEPFLAVTNATIFTADGKRLFQTNFLAIRREQLVWVTLVDQIKDGETHD